MNRGVNSTTAQIFNNHNFYSAQLSQIPSLLRSVECYEKTALRDAARVGNTYMLQLFLELAGQGALSGYQLIHIILTDGEDTGSGISENEFLQFNRTIGSQIPKEVLQIIYIGVDLEQEGVNQISRIINSSRQNTSFKQVDSAHIIDAFEQIQLNFHVMEAQSYQGPNISYTSVKYERHQATISVRRKLGVLFSLDASGSMNLYNRWNQVCEAVKRFINNLSSDDFVMAIIFDTNISIVSHKNIEIWNQRIRRSQRNNTNQTTQPTYIPVTTYTPVARQGIPDIDKNICCNIF